MICGSQHQTKSLIKCQQSNNDEYGKIARINLMKLLCPARSWASAKALFPISELSQVSMNAVWLEVYGRFGEYLTDQPDYFFARLTAFVFHWSHSCRLGMYDFAYFNIKFALAITKSKYIKYKKLNMILFEAVYPVHRDQTCSYIFSCDQAALRILVCLALRLSHLFHNVPVNVSSWNFQG